MNDTSQTNMCPDDRRIGMAFEQVSHLVQVNGFGLVFCHWHVHVTVKDHYQADFTGKIQYAVECRIGQARCLTGYFRRNELFVNGKLANSCKYPGESS